MGKYDFLDDLQKDIVDSYDKRDYGGVQSAQYLNMSKEGVSYFKVKKGKNAMDIIPFIHGTDLFPGKKKGAISFMLDIYVHKNFNQQWDKCICMKRTFGKPCPFCEERDRLKELDGDEYKDRIEALNAKRRVILNAINLKPDEEDEFNGQIQIFDDVHYYFYRELVEEASAEDAGNPVNYVHPEYGKTVHFRANQEAKSKGKFFTYKTFSFEDREESYPKEIIDFDYSDDILDHGAFQLDTLLNIPTYEEAEALLRGGTAQEDVSTVKEEEQEGTEVEEKEVCKEKKRTTPPVQEAPKTKDEPEKNACPFGHNFGKDNMETEDCVACKKKHTETFKECMVESLG
jgi:hypothetical protein